MTPSEGARSDRDEGGFSLLEVVVALVILLTVLVSVSSLMVTAFKVGANSRFRQAATEIATSTLDAQVQTGAATLLADVGDSSLPSVTSVGQVYLAELEVTPYQPGSAGCQSPVGNGEAMLKVTVWVTWADEPSGATWWVSGSSSGTSLLVEETTLLAVPGTDLNAKDGTILVTVDNAAGAGVQGVVVTATNAPTGTTTLTATTTSSGCALFTNITPGDDWTITGSKSGYIDNADDWSTGTNSPATLTSGTTPVDVLAATTTTEAWYYDYATVTPSYSVTLAGYTPWLPTNLNNLPLTFYSSYFPSNVTSYASASPAAVYPYLSTTQPSYYVVAGSCGSQSDPDGDTTDGQPVTLTSGGSAAPVIPLTPVNLVVTHSGTAVSNASVTASVGSDSSCISRLTMPTLGLGSTCIPGVACAVNVADRRYHGGHAADAILVATSTSTGITSSLNPSTYGGSVTFTAKVTATGTTTPAGTVKFTAGGVTISGCATVGESSTSSGSSPTSRSASFTCAISSLAVGDTAIVATFTPTNSNNFGTSNASLPQTVNGFSTSTGLSSTPNPNAYTSSTVLTAAVTATGTAATPTGAIDFENNGTPISGCGSQSLGATTGQATCTVSGLTGGTSYSITAVYTPTGGFLTSTSSPLTQYVTSTTSTAVTSSDSQNASTFGSSVTLTATVTAASGGPATGTVAFTSNGSPIAACSSVAVSSGTAACTTTALALGSDAISAAYTTLNSNLFGSSTGALTFNVYSSSATPSILSGLPCGVWILTVTYGSFTNSTTVLTVTATHISISVNGVSEGTVSAGSVITIAV